MFASRVSVAMFLLTAAVLAAVCIGVDQWYVYSLDNVFGITGLKKSCTSAGCLDNSYSNPFIVQGTCNVSSDTFEKLNRGSWGTEIAGVSLLGLGALLMFVSGFVHSVAFYTTTLVAASVGAVTFFIGGAVAYYTHSDWVQCGGTVCDNYYDNGGKYCYYQLGPSFVLWVMTIAMGMFGIVSGSWLLLADYKKIAVLKQGLRGSSTTPTVNQSPLRSSLRMREPSHDPTSTEIPLGEQRVVIPPGYTYHNNSGMYYAASEDTFFDQRNGHYFSQKHNAWYDPTRKEWYKSEMRPAE